MLKCFQCYFSKFKMKRNKQKKIWLEVKEQSSVNGKIEGNPCQKAENNKVN